MSKALKTILSILIIMLLGTTCVQASGDRIEIASAGGVGDIISDGDEFINKGSKPKISQQEAINQFLPIGRILVQIATVVLVIVGLILGIKYMLSGADQKANVKQKLIWYVVSVALVYGAVGIFNIVTSIVNNIFGNGN